MKKILILSANPKNTDKLRLDQEVREIQAALKLAKNREQFEIVTAWAIRVEDLRRALLEHQPTIVHFSGHGNGSTGLALENNSGQMQLVSTESLAKLFGLFQDKIQCVLLNACYSQVQAEAIHQHIDYVVGMNQAIGDVAAIEFAVGFYDALGAGRPYEDCFKVGCASIDLQGIPESETPILKARQRLHSFSAIEETENKTKLEKNSTMSERKSQLPYSGISQSVSGGRMYGGMIATQGNNNQQTMTNYTTPEQKHNLVQAAQEIQQLLQHLEQIYPTKSSAEKMMVVTKAVDEIENNPPLKACVIGALKAGGTEAFKELINHPLVNIMMASIEGWQEAE
ncbi:MAG: CHAT domain-containing protein [Fischerella sp. CENA71]|nr:CHAT domain-containing protein [Fischerella sp. CENA71]